MMKPFHYSWVICAGCTLLLFCTVGLATSAFSVYQPYMIAAGALSNTQASEITTVRSLFALLSFLLVENFYRRMDIRLGATLAAAGSAVSFILYGVSRDFTGYCLAAAVTGVAYGLGGMIPVSILIERWFRSHKALALGICAAGTGAATIAAPPVVTAMIENLSLASAFFIEALFIGAAAAAVFILLRNHPGEKRTTPLFTGKAHEQTVRNTPRSGAGRGVILSMLAAFVMMGGIANPGFSHLAVLYKSVNFDSMTTAFLISFVGIALTAGKLIYGQVTDRMGAYRSGFLFFGLLIAGEILCCLAGTAGLNTALTAMLCLGLGLPLSTVGLSVYASDMAPSSGYERTVRWFQMAYMIGALVFGPVPGMIADATGSYIPFYILISLFAAVSMLFVQLSYKRMVISPGV